MKERGLCLTQIAHALSNSELRLELFTGELAGINGVKESQTLAGVTESLRRRVVREWRVSEKRLKTELKAQLLSFIFQVPVFLIYF